MNEQKPCPFCGFESPGLRLHYGANAYCPNCGAEGPTGRSVQEARDAWNRRIGIAVDGARGAMDALARARREGAAAVKAAAIAAVEALELRGEREYEEARRVDRSDELPEPGAR